MPPQKTSGERLIPGRAAGPQVTLVSNPPPSLCGGCKHKVEQWFLSSAEAPRAPERHAAYQH